MKPGIHPDYRPVVFQDANTGAQFLTRSTITSSRTIDWESTNRCADLPLGGGRSVQRLAPVLDRVAAHARHGRPSGEVLSALRPSPVAAAKSQG